MLSAVQDSGAENSVIMSYVHSKGRIKGAMGIINLITDINHTET